MRPLVSILIPAYNSEHWIAESIKSALAQTWQPKEIIIVDDGSRDRTLAIARQFASPLVSVVTQENRGAAAARNKALALSQGDFIQWLDADDILAPDKVAKQMEVLLQTENPRMLTSGPWGHFSYRVSRATFQPSPLWCDLSPVEWFIRKFNYNAHMQTATWLISRDQTRAAGPWDTRLGSNDDGEYLCRVMKQCDLIRFVPEARTFYRVTGSARLSHVGQSPKKAAEHLLGIKLQIAHVLSVQDSERTRAACMQRLRTWSRNYYVDGEALTEEAKGIAQSLGDVLTKPRLSWKYAWIAKIAGLRTARRLRLSYNNMKCMVCRTWHAFLSWLERKWGLQDNSIASESRMFNDSK